MLHLRRVGEEWPDQCAPFAEIFGLAECHHMVLDAVPSDDQAIAGRVLDGSIEPEAPAELIGSHEETAAPEAPAPVSYYNEPAAAPKAVEPEPIPAESEPVSPEPEPDPNRPKRSGWWQRAKASLGS